MVNGPARGQGLAGSARHPAYEEPFHWWGPPWDTPRPQNLLDLIRCGTLTAGQGGLLWARLARRQSVVVVAGPRGAGKTTLLNALIDCYPSDTRRFYLRGCFEPFSFLSDPAVQPGRSLLLVNEFSPHLPSYLWGSGVARVLTAIKQGFAVVGTAHAADAVEFVASLAGFPLRIAPALIGGIDLIVALTDGAGDGHRTVAGIWTLRTVKEKEGSTEREREGSGLDIRSLLTAAREADIIIDKRAESDDRGRGPSLGSAVAGSIGGDELRQRSAYLSALADRPNEGNSSVAEHLAAWPMPKDDRSAPLPDGRP